MTYMIERYTGGSDLDPQRAEYDTLAEARAEAQRRVGQNAPDFCGACPDEDDGDLIGVECWMPYLNDDYIPDGTIFVYRRASAKRDFPIGVRVEGGEGEDYDTGTVVEAMDLDAAHPMASGDNVFVAWDSGVRTWAPISDLRTA